MPSAQLDQFSRALETQAVVPLVLAVFAAALLGFALKWIENRLVRMLREKKQREARGYSECSAAERLFVNCTPPGSRYLPVGHKTKVRFAPHPICSFR